MRAPTKGHSSLRSIGREGHTFYPPREGGVRGGGTEAREEQKPGRKRECLATPCSPPLPPLRKGGKGHGGAGLTVHLRPRRGYTAVDVLVVLFLIGLFAMVLLMAMPRGREAARLSACQRNLAQIGMALALYDQTQRRLPMIGEPVRIDPPADQGSPGPLKILLETFGLADFMGLSAATKTPPPARPVPGEIPVPGFTCGSDP